MSFLNLQSFESFESSNRAKFWPRNPLVDGFSIKRIELFKLFEFFELFELSKLRKLWKLKLSLGARPSREAEKGPRPEETTTQLFPDQLPFKHPPCGEVGWDDHPSLYPLGDREAEQLRETMGGAVGTFLVSNHLLHSVSFGPKRQRFNVTRKHKSQAKNSRQPPRGYPQATGRDHGQPSWPSPRRATIPRPRPGPQKPRSWPGGHTGVKIAHRHRRGSTQIARNFDRETL